MSPNRFSSYGLLFRCPFEKERPNCPLEELRNLSIEERIFRVKKMSLSELNIIALHYNNCVEAKKNLQKKTKP